MTTHHHTPIENDAPALPATFNDPLGELDDAITKLANGTTPMTPVLTRVNLGSATEVTIAGGVIAVTQSRHTVDTEADASSDNLDTINGGSEGDLIYLQTVNSARDVVVKHLTGNIYCKAATDVTLGDARRVIALMKNGSTWSEV